MTGPRQSKTIFVLTALLILALAFPTAAGASIARSAQERIPGYGITSSQPQNFAFPATPSFPSPQPEKPVAPAEPAPTTPVSPPSSTGYTFSGGSYGLARSGSRGSLYGPYSTGTAGRSGLSPPDNRNPGRSLPRRLPLNYRHPVKKRSL